MSGGAKAVSSGRSRLLKGVDALWNEFERGAHETGPTDNVSGSPPKPRSSNHSISNDSISDASVTLSPMETTSQQAGRFLSKFSSFLSRKTEEFTQAMEVKIGLALKKKK
jgi:hypothetical protein